MVGVSPKRILLFEAIQINNDCDDSIRIKSLSKTRWTTRGPAAEVIIQKHKELQTLLTELQQDSSATPECRAKSRGILNKICDFSVIFCLVAMQNLAVLLENRSKQLQSSTLTAEDAVTCITALKVRLKTIRSDEEFENIFKYTTNLVCCKDTEKPTKRRKFLPAALANSVLVDYKAPFENTDLDTKSKLRSKFYEAIDSITSSIDDRFEQDGIKKLSDISNCLISAANGETADTESFAHLSRIIDVEMLKRDLKDLPVHVKLFNKEAPVPIKKVTKVSTICDILNSKQSTKECLPYVHKVLVLYNSIPLASATAERSFSVMRRVKSWLRSTMSANTLNNRMFATIHKTRIDSVDSERIARQFIAESFERQNYFGSF